MSASLSKHKYFLLKFINFILANIPMFSAPAQKMISVCGIAKQGKKCLEFTYLIWSVFALDLCEMESQFTPAGMMEK